MKKTCNGCRGYYQSTPCIITMLVAKDSTDKLTEDSKEYLRNCPCSICLVKGMCIASCKEYLILIEKYINKVKDEICV